MNTEPLAEGGANLRVIPAPSGGELRAPALALRRAVLVALVAASTLGGTALMAAVLHPGGTPALGWMIVVLFLFTFAWISAAFWTAVAGFALRLLRLDPLSLRRTRSAAPGRCARVDLRTAVVMPVCNEDPERVTRGIEAICHSLFSTGREAGFDICLLSDSSDPALIWLEERAVRSLRRRLAGRMRIRYRRRARNTGRKAGNIADFCLRWGERYEYMVVLDADSLMEGRTLVELVDRMDANPRAALLQTLPILVRQRTLFGRMQQFANAVYAPMLGAGLAFWQGGTANYWGHNAILRVRPFLDHCRLPVLPGRPPLGGEILSHDFVEAALLRRAGWEVWLLPDLAGSYEEVPANVVDYLKRDRRWLQGNLQHLRLLAEPGLHPVSRVHFSLGAMSFLVSVLWLLMLAAGTAVAVHAAVGDGRADMVPGGSAGLVLLGVTALMLLVPRLLGLGLAFAYRRGEFGGGARLLASGLAETLHSVLLAPLMMFFHTRFVVAMLAGRDVAWGAQHRGVRGVSWWEALRGGAGAVGIGFGWGVLVLLVAPAFFWWILPVVVGLVMAPGLVHSSASRRAGEWLRRRRSLLAPVESAPSPVLEYLDRLEQGGGGAAADAVTAGAQRPQATPDCRVAAAPMRSAAAS